MTLIQISPQLHSFHLAASIGKAVQWDMFSPKELAKSPHWLQSYKSIRRQPNHLPWTCKHCWLPLPVLLHPLLPSFSTLCQYHSLVILNKARSHSAYFNVFYLTDSFPLKVTQEQNLSDGALLAVSPSSVWSTNRKIASIFKIRKKYVHTNVLRQTVLGTWITICL